MRTFLFILSAVLLVGVSEIHAQMIYSKDGVPMGDRETLIQNCVDGAATSNDGIIKVSEREVQIRDYCSCVMEQLIPTMTSDEMMAAVQNKQIMELFAEKENMKIILDCISDDLIDKDYQFNTESFTGIQKEMAIKSCIHSFIEELEESEESELAEEEVEFIAEKYCDCAINKMMELGVSYEELMEIEDEESVTFNEIAGPCIDYAINSYTELMGDLEALEMIDELTSYHKEDIVGGKKSEKIQLIEYLESGYRIKLTIGGITKYFLFDTGASDLIINAAFAEELLENGFLSEENFLYETEYSLADNSTMEGLVFLLSDIKVGNYTVNNVAVGVIESGSLLCGKSLLDKFKKWEVNKKDKTLILYK